MCYAASAWNTKLLEPAKAKNLPEMQLKSIISLPFDLQIVFSWWWILKKKGVILKETPGRAETTFCSLFTKCETPSYSLFLVYFQVGFQAALWQRTGV